VPNGRHDLLRFRRDQRVGIAGQTLGQIPGYCGGLDLGHFEKGLCYCVPVVRVGAGGQRFEDHIRVAPVQN